MVDKNLTRTKSEQGVDQFLRQVENAPIVKRNSAQARLLFAMDATASREPTWELARRLQSDMFMRVREVGGLDVQLLYFRGYAECKSSPWVSDPAELLRFMRSVRCEAGATQIERVLQHAIRENQKKPIHAVVYVGDCVEESVDLLGVSAGELRLHNLPLFIFQEGNEPLATQGFAQLAKVSGGAHCRFDHSSAEQLGALLNAAAIYATGGVSALKQFSLTQSASVKALLEQIESP